MVDLNKSNDDQDTLEWISHPVKYQPVRGIIAAVICVIVWAIVWLWTENLLFLVLSVVFLFASLGPFYMKTTYKLSPKGIEKQYIGFKTMKPWTTFIRFYPDRNGILLSPFDKHTFLENYRSLYLRFEAGGEEILAYVRRQMESNSGRA